MPFNRNKGVIALKCAAQMPQKKWNLKLRFHLDHDKGFQINTSVVLCGMCLIRVREIKMTFFVF